MSMFSYLTQSYVQAQAIVALQWQCMFQIVLYQSGLSVHSGRVVSVPISQQEGFIEWLRPFSVWNLHVFPVFPPGTTSSHSPKTK